MKNMNIKVSNLMLETNETKFLVQHESCECKCRLNENVCNYKQTWNREECQCENKELNDWIFCKNVTCETLLHVILSVEKHAELVSIYILKIVHVKKCTFGKLLLACEAETLNATEATSVIDKKSNRYTDKWI